MQQRLEQNRRLFVFHQQEQSEILAKTAHKPDITALNLFVCRHGLADENRVELSDHIQ